MSPWIWPSDPVYFVSPAGRIQAYDFIAEKRKLEPKKGSRAGGIRC